MNPIETETTQRNNQKNENIEKLKNQHLPSVEKIKKRITSSPSLRKNQKTLPWIKNKKAKTSKETDRNSAEVGTFCVTKTFDITFAPFRTAYSKLAKIILRNTGHL